MHVLTRKYDNKTSVKSKLELLCELSKHRESTCFIELAGNRVELAADC